MTDASFWDKVAPKYALSPIGNPQAYEYTLDRTRSYLKNTDQVLEMGCGTGSTALLLASSVDHLTATDISPAMIAIAKGKPTPQTNITFAVQDAVPEGRKYDAVLAFNLFHLVPEMENRFRQIHAALPEGGYFISKSACLRGGLKGIGFAILLPMLRAMGKAPYVRRFTATALEQAITAAGFDIVESGNHPGIARYVVARKRAS
ncbi:class I SAM-dependent DNA methyltransferase [Loktanella agnita]|uniref:class I SAM-dependent DNA methyltransferase n=1 Tax=Loktanella agnita TaxID=287097 RepID=UPI003989C2FA